MFQNSFHVHLVDKGLRRRNQILEVLKENLNGAQVQMKQQSSKHKTECLFEVGDVVYLKIAAITTHDGPLFKLSPRFRGLIIQKIRAAALQTLENILLLVTRVEKYS